MTHRQTLEIRIKSHERCIQELHQQIACLDAFPDDDFEVGSVITFEKTFTRTGKAYTYAAVKTPNKWYTTGPSTPKGYSWDELKEWLLSGCPVEKVFWASEWTEL